MSGRGRGVSTLLSLLFAASLASCGSDGDEDDPNAPGSASARSANGDPGTGSGVKGGAGGGQTGTPGTGQSGTGNRNGAGSLGHGSSTNSDSSQDPDDSGVVHPMPKDFVGNWFGYDAEGSMFLLTFTEDNEAALLKRSYRGESETIWEARPERSGQRIRFGEDDTYKAAIMPVDGTVHLSYKFPGQLVSKRVTLDKTEESIGELTKRTHREEPDPKALDAKKAEEFLGSLKPGGRNWKSFETFEESSHLVNPVKQGQDFALRPKGDIPIVLPGAGSRRSARFTLECLRLPDCVIASGKFNIVAELHSSEGVQVLVEEDYIFNPATWEQEVVLHWQRASAAGEIRDLANLYVYLTEAGTGSKAISNIVKLTAILTEE